MDRIKHAQRCGAARATTRRDSVSTRSDAKRTFADADHTIVYVRHRSTRFNGLRASRIRHQRAS
jgi:hypothetical protein